MRQTTSYDVAIAGCGAMGSAAAYHLARAGKNVLILEQFEIGHKRGSSHGGSRIIRYTHELQEQARQMPATFDLWRQLERESGQSLLTLTGGIYAGSPHNQFVRRCRETVAALNFDFAEFDGASARKRYPQFDFPDDWIVLFQPETGKLAASLCVKIMAGQAIHHGATLRERARVDLITPGMPGVEIRFTSTAGSETVYADKCIITAGAWVNQLLTDLIPAPIPLRITHQQVAYYPVSDRTAFSPTAFPIFVIDTEPHFYGFPILERPGHIKIAVEQLQREINPDSERVIDEDLLRDLGQLIAQFLPSVGPEPVYVEPCLYTETANREFVIDRLPSYPQIVVGAGFSGRGFKHSIAIGQLLAGLSQTEPGVYDNQFWLDSYRITRFAKQTAISQ